MKRLGSISNPLRANFLYGWTVAMAVECLLEGELGLDNRQVTEIAHSFGHISRLLNAASRVEERSGRYRLNAIPTQD